MNKTWQVPKSGSFFTAFIIKSQLLNFNLQWPSVFKLSSLDLISHHSSFKHYALVILNSLKFPLHAILFLLCWPLHWFWIIICLPFSPTSSPRFVLVYAYPLKPDRWKIDIWSYNSVDWLWLLGGTSLRSVRTSLGFTGIAMSIMWRMVAYTPCIFHLLLPRYYSFS